MLRQHNMTTRICHRVQYLRHWIRSITMLNLRSEKSKNKSTSSTTQLMRKCYNLSPWISQKLSLKRNNLSQKNSIQMDSLDQLCQAWVFKEWTINLERLLSKWVSLKMLQQFGEKMIQKLKSIFKLSTQKVQLLKTQKKFLEMVQLSQIFKLTPLMLKKISWMKLKKKF